MKTTLAVLAVYTFAGTLLVLFLTKLWLAAALDLI